MKKTAIAAAVVMGGSLFAGVSGTGTAHGQPSPETWLALVVNATNSQGRTAAYWNKAATAEEGWAQGVKSCQAEFHGDGKCDEATSSRRCIGVALGTGNTYYTAWGDTAQEAFAAAQAKSPLKNQASGKGRCAFDDSSTT